MYFIVIHDNGNRATKNLTNFRTPFYYIYRNSTLLLVWNRNTTCFYVVCYVVFYTASNCKILCSYDITSFINLDRRNDFITILELVSALLYNIMCDMWNTNFRAINFYHRKKKLSRAKQKPVSNPKKDICRMYMTYSYTKHILLFLTYIGTASIVISFQILEEPTVQTKKMHLFEFDMVFKKKRIQARTESFLFHLGLPKC